MTDTPLLDWLRDTRQSQIDWMAQNGPALIEQLLWVLIGLVAVGAMCVAVGLALKCVEEIGRALYHALRRPHVRHRPAKQRRP
jgi:hypothetical protein